MRLSALDYAFVLGVPNFANYESSASLVAVPRNGGEVHYACIGEDRLAREKLTFAFPLRAIQYCLEEFGLESLRQVDLVVTDYARIKRWHNSGPAYRKLEHDYVKLKLDFDLDRLQIIDHHDAHAASCYYPSGFDEAAVLIVDGMGSELETQSLYHAKGKHIGLLERGYDWGIGKLYSLITGNVLPYGPEKGFGKVMGLAPYGAGEPGPVLAFDSRDSGMRTDYSGFFSRQPMSRLVANGLRRCQDRTEVMSPYFTRAAFDVQEECERQLVRMARYAYEKTGCRQLCLAGGVILNGRANHLILEQTPIESIWMPPCVSDTGLSFGLALSGAMHRFDNGGRTRVAMPHAYTGHDYSDAEVESALRDFAVEWRETDPRAVGRMVAAGKVLAWFEGASEFGPRALGHRSIVADPRSSEMKDRLNAGVKLREGYRPYAPSVLEEHAREWFDLLDASPFMLQVCTVKAGKRSSVPAITHVDGTARIQEVSRRHSPGYWELIDSFREATGVPMILNTSFNLNREPIVETPLDALVCAFSTKIDILVFNGRYLVDCERYRSPATIHAIDARRKSDDVTHLARARDRLLNGFDSGEMERFLAAENDRARLYGGAARHELDRFLQQAVAREWRVLVVGTRGHTAMLHDFVTEFVELKVVGFVAVDGAAEPGTLPAAYREITLERVSWDAVDAVLVSTHEYQRDAVALLGAAPVRVATLYDDAMDSLYFLLPEQCPQVRGTLRADARGTGGIENIDDAASFQRRDVLPMAQRYGFIVNYHNVRPATGAPFVGLNHVTPESLRSHVRQLVDNFDFVTTAEIADPARAVDESVAMITFDDSLRDVAEYAAPILAEFGIRATVFVPSLVYVEGDVLLTQKRQLLFGRLGPDRLEAALRDYLREVGRELNLEAEIPPDVYRYDDGKVRRLKTALNYRLPVAVVEDFICRLFDREFDRRDVVDKLYMSRDQLLRLQDVGWEIGGHGHRHLPLSRLSPEEQVEDVRISFEFIASRLERKPRSFAYPFGNTSSYSDDSIAAVRAAGYRLACVVDPRIVKPSDLAAAYRVPRFDVLDLFGRDGSLRADKLEALSTGD